MKVLSKKIPKMKGKKAIPLLNNLRSIDPNVRWEETFDWLFLPKSSERLIRETQILEALQDDCRQNRNQYSNNKWQFRSDSYTDSGLVRTAFRFSSYTVPFCIRTK